MVKSAILLHVANQPTSLSSLFLPTWQGVIDRGRAASREHLVNVHRTFGRNQRYKQVTLIYVRAQGSQLNSIYVYESDWCSGVVSVLNLVLKLVGTSQAV